MQKESCFKGCLKENKIRRHSKLDLESSTQVVSQQKQQRQAWKTLNQVQGDNLVCYNDNAFTLIELLVVVLIIGILAAVALPQYQKAVWKSRNAQLKTLAQSVAQAEQAYYLANGEYSFNFDTLDLDLPLSAPVQNGSAEDKCYFAIAGTDSVRRGKDFEIVLGGNASNTSYVSVQAVWLDDPYKCTGFAWFSDSQKMGCREKHSSGDSSIGDFCEKLEKGSYTSNNGTWYYYDLP